MTLRGAVFLGIGGMVGAGIFALLGEAGAVAGAAVWVSFLVAGAIALLTGYSLVKLGVRYPSSGGVVTYMLKGFGNGRTVGIGSWLGYLTAIVVVGAMVAVSFGDYARTVFVGEHAGSGWTTLFAAIVVVGSTLVTVVGPRWVDRTQTLIVIALLAVFAVFVVATLPSLHPHLLAPSGYPGVRAIVSSVALTFFAFLGFAVISFAAGDMVNPKRNLPRAMYIALGATMILYVAIALSVFGTLTVEQVVAYGPTAIAEAARPELGDAGFKAMSIAALLATASSVVATLYASQGLTNALAEAGQFPPVFGAKSRFGKHGGLYLTTLFTLLFVAFFDLSALASIGSAVSLAMFGLIGVAALKLRHEIHGNVVVILAGISCAVVVFLVFVIDTLSNDPKAFWTTLGLIAASAVVDELWKRTRDRGQKPVATPA
jgi:amino acid transporter